MTKTLSLLLISLCLSSILFGQSHQKIIKYHKGLEQEEKYIPIPKEPAVLDRLSTYRPTSTDPIVSRQTGLITVIKIGEASNAYSTLGSEVNPVTVLNGVGNGGVIAFAYRHNIQKCFPSNDPFDNGRLRYSISTDGGNSWNIGNNLVISVENPAPNNTCFGIGPLNDTYTYVTRYPQAALSLPNESGNLDDVVLAVTNSTLSGLGGEWNGSANITVKGAATDNPEITAESYDLTSKNQSINLSLVERVPGEFWYVSSEYANLNTGDRGDGTIFVYKGIFNQTINQIEWTLNNSIIPNHIVIPGITSSPTLLNPNIAFSPDGNTGYISFGGDLVGGEDSVYSPIFIQTNDGGNSWEDAVEVNMNSFPEMADSLRTLVTIDTIGENIDGTPILDTVPVATGKATLGYDHDLVVDANGNPHFLAIVTVASITANPEASYSIYSEAKLMLFDITKDEFGDWNMMYVAPINTFRSFFPLEAVTNDEAIAVDTHTQLSRSEDGTKIFMTWTDTDTTDPSYEPLDDPDSFSRMTNIAPNLLTRAYDLNLNMLTPIKNWTIDDENWDGQILLPKVSPISLNEEGSNIHKIPTVFARIDGESALFPTSYYYISDISYDVSQDFTESPTLFFNCKSTPFANKLTISQPSCSDNNGEISVEVSGANAPYTYTWETVIGQTDIQNESTQQVDNLEAGVYKLIVSDERGCKDETLINLNNQDAPTLSLLSKQDVSCFGVEDGQAEIEATGGSGELSYLWSNGETTANALNLPKGISRITVTDTSGCQSFLSVEIEEPKELVVEIKTTDVSCNGFSDGQAVVQASGGILPYSLNWNNGMTSPTINGLEAGTYDVQITDANGCINTQSVEINEPEPLIIINLMAVVPNTNPEPPFTGAAFITVEGGTPLPGGGSPYQFIWCGDASENNYFFKAQLPGGMCEVTVIDANGCMISDTVIIEGIPDDTPPTLIGVPMDTEASCNNIPDPVLVTATDNFNDEVNVLFEEFSNNGQGFSCDPLIITRTWSATDGFGNTASESQVITVTDCEQACDILGITAGDPQCNEDGTYDIEVCIQYEKNPLPEFIEVEIYGNSDFIKVPVVAPDNCGEVCLTLEGLSADGEGVQVFARIGITGCTFNADPLFVAPNGCDMAGNENCDITSLGIAEVECSETGDTYHVCLDIYGENLPEIWGDDAKAIIAHHKRQVSSYEVNESRTYAKVCAVNIPNDKEKGVEVFVQVASGCTWTLSNAFDEPKECEELSRLGNETPIGLKIYPNPSTGKIKVVTNHIENAQILVLNSLGQQVFTKHLYTNKENEINIGEFEEGIYIIRVIGTNYRETKKIILQKTD